MFVEVGDIDIFITIAGEGPPCLVPSLAGTPIYERTFSPALAGVMQLIFIELRGNRTATGEIDSLTFEGVVDDLEGVRRALGLERDGGCPQKWGQALSVRTVLFANDSPCPFTRIAELRSEDCSEECSEA